MYTHRRANSDYWTCLDFVRLWRRKKDTRISLIPMHTPFIRFSSSVCVLLIKPIRNEENSKLQICIYSSRIAPAVSIYSGAEGEERAPTPTVPTTLNTFRFVRTMSTGYFLAMNFAHAICTISDPNDVAVESSEPTPIRASPPDVLPDKRDQN